MGTPKRLSPEEQLGNEELERRYRGAKDPVPRGHYRVVRLLGPRGKTDPEEQEAFNRSSPGG